MSLPARSAAVLALVVALAGCAPTVVDPTPTSAGAPQPSASSTPAAAPTPAAAAPETVDEASHLIDGAPYVADSDGYWKGHYAFFTDETETVRCDIYIYSGDSGGVTCATTSGNQGLVTYALPGAQCDESAANPFDGYSVGINFKVFDTGNSGFTGCGVGESFATTPGSELPAPAVLHDNQTLIVSTAIYVYTCTVSQGAATCTDSYTGASITYGLAVAQFQG